MGTIERNGQIIDLLRDAGVSEGQIHDMGKGLFLIRVLGPMGQDIDSVSRLAEDVIRPAGFDVSFYGAKVLHGVDGKEGGMIAGYFDEARLAA